MQISEAFRNYKAKLKNTNWSVSAENPDGELIVSLWSHRFLKPEGNKVRYQDYVERWGGNGSKEMRERIEKAYTEEQTVRAVIATTNDKDVVEDGGDASHLVNTFHCREDWFGKVTNWDGNNFEIEFRSR